ncbi:MAG: hypothetical protein JWP15_1002 [Alphaproteobacteria bacterium]|nr:hypothetical protein [Alphaproteobacteria bacterium]
MRHHILAGAGLLWAASAAIAAPAPAKPDKPAAAQPDRTHLDALTKAADAIDGATDPKGLLAARQAVLAEAEKMLPADSPDLGLVRVELARAWFYNGDMKTALVSLEAGLSLMQKGGEAWVDKVREARGDLAVMYNYVGRHAEARVLFQADYDWYRNRFGPPETAEPTLQHAIALNNLAASDHETGDNEAALVHNAQALAMAERMKPVPNDAAIWYSNRSNYWAALGRFDEAVDAARTGQARIEAILPKGHPYVANNLSNFAALLLKQGRYGEAMDMARRAFEVQEASAGKITQNSATMRIVFARAMIGKGDYEGADAFLAGALPTLEAQLGADSDRTQAAIEARALALSRLGRTREALALEQAVVDARDKRLPAAHRDRMFGREMLADIAMTGGDAKRAEAELATSLALRRKVQPAGNPDLLAARAKLLVVRSRIAPDPALAAEADALLAALAASARYELDRSSLDSVRTSFANVAEALVRLGRHGRAFEAMQWASRTSADDAVAAAAARSALAGRPDLAALLRQRQDLLLERKALFDSVQAQMQRPDPAYDLGRVEAAADGLTGRLAALDTRLDAAGLGSADRFRIAPLAAVQARLAPGDALWMATQLPAGYAVMAVTRGATASALVDSKAEVGGLVGRIRASLDPGGGGAGAFAAADAHLLYAALAPAPVARLLAGRTHLIVAANGPLSSLPFAVLVTRAGPRPAFLIDRVAVSHVPGPASLLRPAGGGGPLTGAAFLAFGDPSSGTPGSGTRGGGGHGTAALRSAGDARTLAQLAALPGSAGELRDLAHAVGARSPHIFTGAAATEAALRGETLPAGGILAFATHGLVSGELEGLREPALVLTPSGTDDGLLTASEIARLSLPASWAILSACDTAAGAGPDSPGLTGLARAFLFAGTRHLLATHWPVRDDVATRLTVGTLSRASAGMAPAEALRQAVLAVRRDPKVKGAGSPSVWGPFVLIE